MLIVEIVHVTINHLQLPLNIFATISYIGHICNYIAITLQLFWFSSFHMNNI
jgi:hypothetical protein